MRKEKKKEIELFGISARKKDYEMFEISGMSIHFSLLVLSFLLPIKMEIMGVVDNGRLVTKLGLNYSNTEQKETKNSRGRP